MGRDAVSAVADELEIRNLLSRLAQLADDAEDLDEYLQLFTEDAVWEAARFGVKKGREEIRVGAEERRAGGTSGPGTHTRHLITTSVIQVDGDAATGRSVFLYLVDTQTHPALSMIGVYEDILRRTSDGWKLAHRRIVSATEPPTA